MGIQQAREFAEKTETGIALESPNNPRKICQGRQPRPLRLFPALFGEDDIDRDRLAEAVSVGK